MSGKRVRGNPVNYVKYFRLRMSQGVALGFNSSPLQGLGMDRFSWISLRRLSFG